MRCFPRCLLTSVICYVSKSNHDAELFLSILNPRVMKKVLRKLIHICSKRCMPHVYVGADPEYFVKCLFSVYFQYAMPFATCAVASVNDRSPGHHASAEEIRTEVEGLKVISVTYVVCF